MKRLENKVVIITGGAAGIGAATDIKFANEGAKMIIWNLDETRKAMTKGTAKLKKICNLFN